jgi:hypothetical protein
MKEKGKGMREGREGRRKFSKNLLKIILKISDLYIRLLITQGFSEEKFKVIEHFHVK